MNISKGEGWTLFLDRDGVINKEQEGTYVTRWEEFEFLPGVLDGLANILSLIHISEPTRRS